MAAATATTTSTTKAQLIKVQAQPIKPKRRRYRETTISSSASTTTINNSESASYLTQTRKHDPPTIASPDNSWCCPASKPLPPPPPPPPPPSPPPQKARFPTNPSPKPDPVTSSPSEFKIQLSPGSQSPVMEFTTTTLLTNGHHHIASQNDHSSFPSSFTSLTLHSLPDVCSYAVEIADCDDVEIYIETLRLMYCKDLRRKLMKEDVPRVLGILKVSAAIGFDAGVLSCLEYLEAAPWTESEEEKVASLLSELRLEGVGASEVLKRVSVALGMKMVVTMKKCFSSSYM
uniref:BTB domain-containing protein n=1 Tax=Salix viminalis TaxID=40686 RepID=A0A6N2MGQ2_SALVM